jgi:uncharacterized Zn-binding protein involved in type VI secretion
MTFLTHLGSRPKMVTLGHAAREADLRILLTTLLLLSGPGLAAGLSDCARSGAVSVMINGRPALRLSDMALCPPGSYSVIPGMMIEGEPMVQVNAGIADCVSSASPDVIVDGQGAKRVGDVVCPPQ